MDIRYASRLLVDIRSEWHKPVIDKKRMYLAANAYERWAFDEIYIYMLAHPSGDPVIAIQELLEEADDKACRATTDDMNLMFSILADICNEVLDVIRLMGDE